MIRLSKSTDYALTALADLALLPGGETLSARRLAESRHLPPELAAKVLQGLRRSGIVETRQGIRGGYRLARPPEEIPITDIIEAVEGPLALVECMLDEGCCELTPTCSVRTPLTRIHERIVATLAELTLAGILADGAFSAPPATGPELPVIAPSPAVSPWKKSPASAPLREGNRNPPRFGDAGHSSHGQVRRIASAIRPTVSRGEGEPSPHPSPAALRAASVPEGLSPQPASAVRGAT